MPKRGLIIFLIVAGLYCCCALYPWHDSVEVRRATGVVLATLILWITEVAPLGVVAMAIPIAATFTGLLPWKDAVAAWGDEIVFLFLGAFLLARALDKHGVFDWIVHSKWASFKSGDSGWMQTLLVMVMAGVLSTLQNNTAVTAMMLPVVLALVRRVKSPAAPLLALAWGATFGGMAVPVGTAPNFIGYSAMKNIDASVSFVSWMRVGVPAWLGSSLIGWSVLTIGSRFLRRRSSADDTSGESDPPRWIEPLVVTDVGPEPAHHSKSAVADSSGGTIATTASPTSPARRIVIFAFLAAATLWLVPGIIRSATSADHPAAIWLRTYLPESLVPVLIAWVLFLIRTGPDRKPILDRHDFQALDWDTLFLIAGGLAMGRMLETSGLASALADGLARADMPPVLLMLCLVGATVLLSELTSNTATASLMVPIAGSLAAALGVSPVQAIWLVALAASLGFALPVSTPPNAIVYGTRMVPLRFMAVTGFIVDALCTVWLVCCVVMWA